MFIFKKTSNQIRFILDLRGEINEGKKHTYLALIISSRSFGGTHAALLGLLYDRSANYPKIYNIANKLTCFRPFLNF